MLHCSKNTYFNLLPVKILTDNCHVSSTGPLNEQYCAFLHHSVPLIKSLSPDPMLWWLLSVDVIRPCFLSLLLSAILSVNIIL